jgi:hypothetical protein
MRVSRAVAAVVVGFVAMFVVNALLGRRIDPLFSDA